MVDWRQIHISLEVGTSRKIVGRGWQKSMEFSVNNNEARERSEPFFPWFSKGKKLVHNGSYEHRVPKIKNKTLLDYVCVIQHRNSPLRSTILNAHGTNASPDGLCTRTHTNEAFSCWFCCNSFRVDRARRGNVCLEACLGRVCLLYTSPSPRDGLLSRMPSSA